MKQQRTHSSSNKWRLRVAFLAVAAAAAAVVITLNYTSASRSLKIRTSWHRRPSDFPAFCESVAPLDTRTWSDKLRTHLGGSRSTANLLTQPLMAVYEASKLSLDAGQKIWSSQVLKPDGKPHQPSIMMNTAGLNTTAVLDHAGPYPVGAFKGRGIVIVGGGPKYSPPAFVCVTLLRKTGCLLPIEVWAPPHEVIPAAVAYQFEALGAAVMNLGDVFPVEMHHTLRKHVSKPAAIIASSFREVMLLDSDNIPLSDPTYLFEHQLYTNSGLLMWPDFWPCEAKSSAWDALAIPQNLRPAGSHESGQMLVDKQRGWQPLLLALYLNVRGDVFYPMLSNIGQGDKETFAFAWLSVAAAAAGQNVNQPPFYANVTADYGLVSHGVMALGVWKDGNHDGFAMLQRSPEGAAMFIHAHLPKADLNVGDTFERKWLNMTGDVTVIPPGSSKNDTASYRILNAVAGYDVEQAVHKLRQQLRCAAAWVDCCL